MFGFLIIGDIAEVPAVGGISRKWRVGGLSSNVSLQELAYESSQLVLSNHLANTDGLFPPSRLAIASSIAESWKLGVRLPNAATFLATVDS